MNEFFKRFKSKCECSGLATWVSAFISLLTLIVLFFQLNQLNNLKRYENYNAFNKVYYDWYDDMPDNIKKNCQEREKIAWDKLDNDDRAWTRRYFDLYAQEYYLYKENMIPKEMWEKQIHGTKGCYGAAMLNMREYPILLVGYKEWKKRGAFQHPENFTEILDNKIKECKHFLNQTPVRCGGFYSN